jgi:hypothetical protein
MVHGGRGELTILVNGAAVVESGWAAFLGVMPSVSAIVAAVRAAREASSGP